MGAEKAGSAPDPAKPSRLLLWLKTAPAALVTGLVERRISISIWLVVIGFIMVIASIPLDIVTVSFKGYLKNGFDAFSGNGPISGALRTQGKEVGFLMALNWSLFITLIAPAIVWFALNTVQAFSTTLRELCSEGMVRNTRFEKIGYDYFQSNWERHIGRNRLLFVVIVVAVLGFIMNDWWMVVGRPILFPDSVNIPFSDPTMEYDWSVSALFQGMNVNTTGLLIFGFIGYFLYAALVPAFVIAVSLCTIYYMFFITNLRINQAEADGASVRFAAVPTPSAKDRHFGFKAFSDLFHNFLLMSLFILIGLWLMAVQNIYLRDPASTDIYSFIIGEADQYTGLFNGTVGLFDFIGWFAAPARFMIHNIQVGLSALLFPVVCISAVTGCWFVLRNQARKAQDFSLQHTREIAAEYDTNEELFADKLENHMEVWPIGWITSQRLLSLMFFMFISLISYRLIVIPLAVMGLLGLGGIFKSLISNK